MKSFLLNQPYKIVLGCYPLVGFVRDKVSKIILCAIFACFARGMRLEN